MYQHYPQITNKGLYSYNSINVESRGNSRFEAWFFFLFVEYISASLATANLMTLTVNFINLSILSVKFIWLILPALWFHSFNKITCVSKLIKGRIKIHSPTKLYPYTQGSKRRCIYYLYVRNSVLLFNPCMDDILQLRKNILFLLKIDIDRKLNA